MKIKCRLNAKKTKRFKLRWEKYHGLKCAYCCSDCSELATIDHILPLSKGGGNDLKNLVISCLKCNQEKADKTLEEYKPLMLKPLGVINESIINN